MPRSYGPIREPWWLVTSRSSSGLYAARGWSMFPTIDRVYVNARARDDLGWQPRYDYRRILDCLAAEQDFRSPLAREIGAKGYHDEPTGVYTT